MKFMNKNITILIFIIIAGFSCGTDVLNEVTGVATWRTDYKYCVVGINHTETEDPFMGKSTSHTKCDLILCDSLVNPIDTLFLNRDLPGTGLKIEEISYSEDDNYVFVQYTEEADGDDRYEFVYNDGTAALVYGLFMMNTWNMTTSSRGKLVWDSDIEFFMLDTTVTD